MPTITIVFFWSPNATIYCEPSRNRNCATDHSEWKYFGKTPDNTKKKKSLVQHINCSHYKANRNFASKQSENIIDIKKTQASLAIGFPSF